MVAVAILMPTDEPIMDVPVVTVPAVRHIQSSDIVCLSGVARAGRVGVGRLRFGWQ